MSAFAALVARRGGIELPRTLRAMTATWGAEAPHGVALRCFGDDGRPASADGAATGAAAAGLAHGLLVARDGATLGPHALDDRYWLAGDIRLDAQDALRAALRDAGAPLRGDECDDRLVLHAYAAWGDACVTRLLGDFSFALWNAETRALLCARDGMGVRPLYFADLGDVFICSNVLAAVRAHPLVPATLHEPAIVSFLQWGFNVDAARTTFAAVRRLPPARQFAVSAARGVHQDREHWRFPEPSPLRYADEREYVEHYREILGEAVRDRLRVPRVAILLSGGLDSTSLAATARRVAPEVQLDAFTVDLSSRIPDDEGRLAALVARQLGIAHHVTDGWSEPLEYLDDPSFTPPEPLDAVEFAEGRRGSARIAAVSSVAFIGEDGDSLFDPPGLATMARTWGVWDVARRVASFVATHRRTPHSGLWLRRRLRDALHPPESEVPRFVRADVAARTPAQRPDVTRRHPTRPESYSYLASTAWQHAFELSRPAWSGAAHEVRWPLLDARLIAFVWAIPPIPWCQGKELTRVAFRGELPGEVLRRPKTPVRGEGPVIESALGRWFAGRNWSPGRRMEEFVDTDQLLTIVKAWNQPDLEHLLSAVQLDAWLNRLR